MKNAKDIYSDLARARVSCFHLCFDRYSKVNRGESREAEQKTTEKAAGVLRLEDGRNAAGPTQLHCAIGYGCIFCFV